MSDGYMQYIEKYMTQFSEMENLHSKQVKLNKDIVEIAKEINGLPKMPKNLDKWMNSVPDGNSKKRFKLNDYAKLFKISRKYTDLVEERDINGSKLKVVVIDNLIDKIKKVLNGE